MIDSFLQSVKKEEEEEEGREISKVRDFSHGRDGILSTGEEVAAHLSSGCLPVF